MKPPRIVSLLPACTEIICALGFEELLVGKSHECDFPVSVRSLPVCTRSSIDSSAGSGEIHRQVKARFEQAVSLYDLEIERIRELQPDVILTQAQCDVCAVSLEDVERAMAEAGVDAKIVSVSPARLSDLWECISSIAQACGGAEEGRKLIKRLKSRMVDVIEKTCALEKKPSMICLEWLDPLMTAGNWVPDLVDLAGGIPMLAKSGEHSPWVEWDAVRNADPHFLLLIPCGFSIERTLGEARELTKLPGWENLRAVQKRNIVVADANHFFNRPGPRLIDSMEMLAEMLHPAKFDFGHAGKSFRRFVD